MSRTERRRRKRAKAPRIEILIQSARWRNKPRLAPKLRKAITLAAQQAANSNVELALVLTDDPAIRALNLKWRKFDAPTNVLSFPAARGRPTPHVRVPVGDIVISYDTTKREAAAEGKPFEHHLIHLAVHGFLHLLGHDHDTARAAKRMEALETKILARLRIPDPYADAR